MATRERTLRKTQEIPSGHDPARYVARPSLCASAADGEDVPITVLMLKDTPLDGSAPLLLYGYGSYGMAAGAELLDPNPRASSTAGWIWATAHIRGGSDKGWGWFLDGRKQNKPNTFTDFIASAEHLIVEGYATLGRIASYGGSAGGMLMGAIANLRPDLWGAIIAAVPFVDVLNTMSDTTLPLTPPEWPEWGNPLQDAAAYDLIAGYSPYDQVAAKAYPPILATGGLSDPRVTYWEPAKWITRLRETSTGDAPMLLKINMEAGHGGASGRFDFLKEIALDYAFAIWALDEGLARLGRHDRSRRRQDADAAGPGRHLRLRGAARLWHLRRRRLRPPPTWTAAAGAVQDQGLPYLVAEDEGQVLGYAYASLFRPRPGYRFTVEDSVYVSPDAMGRASAAPVLTAVLEACRGARPPPGRSR